MAPRWALPATASSTPRSGARAAHGGARHSHTLLYICIASVILNTDLIQRTQGGVWVAWPPAAQNLKLTGLTHNIFFS